MSLSQTEPSNALSKLHQQMALLHIGIGAVLLGLVNASDSLERQHQQIANLMILIGIFLIYILNLVLVRRYVIQPVKHLRHFADELIASHLNEEDPPRHPDAFIHLNNAFLQLSQAVDSSQTKVAQQNGLLMKNLDQWRTAEKTLSKLNGKLNLATQAASIGIWDWLVVEDVHDWDRQTFALLGIDHQSVKPSLREWFRRVHPADLPKLQGFIQLIRHSTIRQHRTDYRILLSDNSIRQLAFFAQTTLDEENQVVRVTTVQMDITEQKMTEKRILYLATHDPLTGFYSRSGLREIIQKTMQTQQQDEGRFVVLHLDLDRFKNINDAMGHLSGDELLQIISVKLSRLLRKTDAIARLGGDEFVILLSPIASEVEVLYLCRRFLEIVALPHSLHGNEIKLTASIGSAMYPVDATDADTLLRHADISMQQVKLNGGNGYLPFISSMVKDAESQLQLEQKLRRALDMEILEVFFQAKVDTFSRTIIGAEALVRWPKPEGGYISPASFIPLAEERGLIETLNLQVLQKTLRQIRMWQDMGIPLVPVSVNLSAGHFSETSLPQSLADMLQRFDLEPGLLQIEITESTLLRDSDQIEKNLQIIRQMGIKVSIDDFGTGYSSLSYLHRFKVDDLKLDRSFIAMSGHEQGEVSLVPGIIDIAHALGLSVTAEGVETTQQYEFLKLHDCDQIQGFLFAKPVPANEFADLIKLGTIEIE